MPTVSVVIPSYNHEKFIGECLNSVLNQTFQDFEIIITDDGSTDRTVEILESFDDPRIRIFKHIQNKGTPTAINNCILHASGAYIAALGSDDAWYPEKLEVQVRFLEEHPDIAAVFSRVDWVDERGVILAEEQNPFKDVFKAENRTRFEWLNLFFLQGNCLNMPSSLIRAACLREIGLLNPVLANLHDFDLWVRICMAHDIFILDEKLVRYRWMSNNKNLSAYTKQTHIRSHFEQKQILNHFLKVKRPEELLSIFPAATRYGRVTAGTIPYFLGRVAIDSGSDFRILWGEEVIFSIFQDEKIARKLEEFCSFTYPDFFNIVKSNDTYKYFVIQDLYGTIETSNRTIESSNRTIETLNRELAEIKTSREWRLVLLVRRLRQSIAPPGSRRDRLMQWVWNLFILPYIQFRKNRKINHDLALIRSSSFFDREWYLENNPDLAQVKIDPARHYLLTGGIEGRDPGPEFSSSWYLEMYKDVKDAHLNPLLHYLQHGQEEGRVATSAELRSRSKSVYKDYKAILSAPKRVAPPKTSLTDRMIRSAYFINQRLPLSESGRQKLQRSVYKLFPAFFYRYKRSVNNIASEKYFSSKNGQRHPSSSFKDLFLTGDESQLALWAYLLKVNESTLSSLLVPPWQVEEFQRSTAGQEAGQSEAIDPSQALFQIVLVVGQAPAHFLYECLRSVQEQTYKNWKLDIYVCEDGAWEKEVLAVQFESDTRIHIRSAASQGEVIAEFRRSARDSADRYMIWLSQFDQLKQGALLQAANELKEAEYDLVYSSADLPVETIYRDLADPRVRSAGNLSEEFAFSQFLIWNKKYLNNLLPEEINSLAELLIQVRTRFTRDCQPNSIKKLAQPYYSYREIPGRTSIILSDMDKKFDILAASLPLRVLLDGRLLGRKTTGTERYIWELLKELARLQSEYDFALNVITMAKPEEPIEGVDFLTDGHIQAIHDSHVFHKTFPASDAGTLAEMGVAPSVVYSPLDMILYSNPDYFFSETDYYHFRKTMQLAVKLSDRIISISKHGKLEMEELLDVPSSKITPVYLGVRPEHFSHDNQDGRHELDRLNVPENYYLFVGTNYPHKNLLTLLRAFKIVKVQIPDISLVMVGTNHYDHPQPELDRLLEELSDHIFQLGHVPDDVLPILYHYAQALVYPSLHEGFGLPLLEAMLCGTAVIASNSTSIPEVCGGEAAILVNGQDEKQIADAMIRIWNDPEERNRLIAAGYKNAVNFSWENTARQTLRCYLDTVDKAIHDIPGIRINEKVNAINELGMDPPTILIATHIRFYPPTAGNELRMLRLVKYFKKLGYRIIMLVNPFLEKSELDRKARSFLHQYVDYYEELGDIPIYRRTDLPVDAGIGNESILGRWRHTEESFCPEGMLQRAASLIEEFSPKIMIANYIWMSRILALAGPDVLKVIDTIDMFSRKSDSVVKFGIQDSLATTPEEELTFINRSDVTIAIQESEADAFRKLGPSCRIITAGIDLDVDPWPSDSAVDQQSPALLIVGSGNQINVHCVTEFLEQTWPRIHREVPSSRLRIVGKVTNSLIANDQSVELIPYVEDLDQVYDQAAVVINPVYAGTGIKVKSLEALGHGKAFVCWPEGAVGLTSNDSKHFIIVQSWDELADSVIDLLQHPDKRRHLERAAWEFARTELSDRVIYRETVDCFDSASKRKLNVLCLYLRYGLDDHPNGLPDLQSWYQTKMNGAQATIWIIDNKLQNDVDSIDLATGYRLLSGDNRQREFSGFQKIVQEHREEIESYDVVHFVTSAFNTLFTGYLDYFSVDHLIPVAHRPICLGHIDAQDEPVQLAGETSQSWIRTCFFFMSPETLYSIPGLVSFTEESEFFDANGEFRNDDRLSENYKQFISGWLNGETFQGVSWHSRISSAKSFTGKTLAILNEHMLAIQLRKAGAKLVDYYWLKDHNQMLSSAIGFPIPDTLEQVKYRQEQLFGSPVSRRINDSQPE